MVLDSELLSSNNTSILVVRIGYLKTPAKLEAQGMTWDSDGVSGCFSQDYQGL